MGETYRAVCHDCGWSSEGASYRDGPFTRRMDAKRAVNGHVGHGGCDVAETEVVRVEGAGE